MTATAERPSRRRRAAVVRDVAVWLALTLGVLCHAGVELPEVFWRLLAAGAVAQGVQP